MKRAPGKSLLRACQAGVATILLSTGCGLGALDGLVGGELELPDSDAISAEPHPDAAEAEGTQADGASHDDSAEPADAAGLLDGAMEASAMSDGAMDAELEGSLEDGTVGEGGIPPDSAVGEGGIAPDGPDSAVRLPIADAYVRDGTYADMNYGADGTLSVKNATMGTTREAYLKFDLSGVGSVTNAKLQISGRGSQVSCTVGVFAVADIIWDEHLITWNNRPTRGAQLGAVVAQVGPVQYEFDVTGYVSAELAARRPIVSFGLQVLVYGAGFVDFDSRESSNSPRLVIAQP
jgi:hypothetical protein